MLKNFQGQNKKQTIQNLLHYYLSRKIFSFELVLQTYHFLIMNKQFYTYFRMTKIPSLELRIIKEKMKVIILHFSRVLPRYPYYYYSPYYYYLYIVIYNIREHFLLNGTIKASIILLLYFFLVVRMQFSNN